MTVTEKILARAFDVGEGAITDEASPETIPSWDSFRTLVMFQELEKESGTSFDIEDLKNIRNVGDIKKLLDKYKIAH